MDSTKIVAWWGAVLSTVGIVLSILNYLLAKRNQKENTAERILVHLDAVRTIINPTDTEPLSLDPEGEVGMEVVNVGLRPLFIKRAEMRIGNEVFVFIFYGHDPIVSSYRPGRANEPLKVLEPSEAIRYKLSWDFSKHPLAKMGKWPDSRDEDIEVQVQTTKKTFVFHHQKMNRIAITSAFGELG